MQAKVRLKIMGNVYPNETSVSAVLPGPEHPGSFQ